MSDLSPTVPRYADPANPIGRAFSPFREFTQTEVSGGILLFLATIIALAWANSPWGDTYTNLWQSTLSFRVGEYGLTKDLSHWINDGLMVIFFFVVGLEIKREVMVGELASRRQAALPIAAALGGAIVPALIYLALNVSGGTPRGWGVPMATDIAFVLGIMALLGDRIPLGLRVFVTALAIVDDLIAVFVIALVYTDAVELWYLVAAAGVLALLIVVNWLDVTRPIIYAVLGVLLWFVFVKSGVHATIAGVLLALTIPARTRIDTRQFLTIGQRALADFRHAAVLDDHILTNQAHQTALQELETAAEQIQSPMQRFEHALHPWVAFLIVPLFALANAGVVFDGDIVEVVTSLESLGIILGLVIGKQLGITLATFLLLRFGLADLPEGVTWRYLYGASCLAGIGFTMSLFVADLAFADPALQTGAKVGILVGSIVAALLGAAVLSPGRHPAPGRESRHGATDPGV